MSYTKSFYDSFSDSLAPAKRKLQNIRTHFLGTKVQTLRLRQTSKNAFGFKEFEYTSEIIDNCIITYPFSSVEMFTSKTVTNSTAIDLLQYLPITMTIPFDEATEADLVSGSATLVNEDDIIVHVFFGHHKEKIPITMRVSRGYAGFSGRNLIKRKYELNLMRGNEVSAIQTYIDAYLSGMSQDT